MFCVESAPYSLPRLLTPRVFVLEYVGQLVQIYEVYLYKSTNKSRMSYPFFMGGEAISDRKGAKEAIW